MPDEVISNVEIEVQEHLKRSNNTKKNLINLLTHSSFPKENEDRQIKWKRNVKKLVSDVFMSNENKNTIIENSKTNAKKALEILENRNDNPTITFKDVQEIILFAKMEEEKLLKERLARCPEASESLIEVLEKNPSTWEENAKKMLDDLCMSIKNKNLTTFSETQEGIHLLLSLKLPDGLCDKMFQFLNRNLESLLNRINRMKVIMIEDDQEILRLWTSHRSTSEFQKYVRCILIRNYMNDMNVRVPLEMLLFDCMNILSSRKDLKDMWTKATNLFSGVNLRDLLAHGNTILEEIENGEESVVEYAFGMSLAHSASLRSDAMKYLFDKAEVDYDDICQIERRYKDLQETCIPFTDNFLHGILLDWKHIVPNIYKTPYIAWELAGAGFNTDPCYTEIDGLSAFGFCLIHKNSQLFRMLYNYAVNNFEKCSDSVRNPSKNIVESLKAVSLSLKRDHDIIRKVNENDNCDVGYKKSFKTIREILYFNEYQSNCVKEMYEILENKTQIETRRKRIVLSFLKKLVKERLARCPEASESLIEVLEKNPSTWEENAKKMLDDLCMSIKNKNLTTFSETQEGIHLLLSLKLPDGLCDKMFQFLNRNLESLLNRINRMKVIMIEDDQEILRLWTSHRSTSEFQKYVRCILIRNYMNDMNVRVPLEMLLFDCMNILSSRKDLKDMWTKATNLFSGVNLRDLLAHGNTILEVVGKLDPEDMPTHIIDKILELIEDGEVLKEVSDHWRDTRTSDLEELKDIVKKHVENKKLNGEKEKEEMKKWNGYLSLLPLKGISQD
ncbi:hypothetical protein JTE90_014447 [Oedothorax gibbosus]|uniref:Uncharacterized protein n=1 Tax=Oedothorax gibbosus TaxID=931172 RepID=A0AAV6V2K2_9ARAC|nr:hypothetical protein JTE90_014447 [Oedothorax gibbosus]